MTKQSPLAAAVLACLSMAGPTQAEDLHIKVIAATCVNCHGQGGQSLGAVPSLAGQDVAYLQTAMLEQRSGVRETTVMRRYMNGYTDTEIAKLAEHFSRLK
ncbi:MAG TPA: sulfide dehydrogenase [Thiobacillaceae bacterium]|nr:sulfide dehydrogenase [Thiobacillaceae bacterium]HNU63372.1 sulfide dehydrogenase [Thiobacillaceae bacterium]